MKHRNVSLFVPHEGCPHACSFCNQKIISGQTQPLSVQDIRNACLTALKSEGYTENGSEIAFFGGSFTAIPVEKQVAYLSAAQEFVGKGMFGGIRISTRPDCITQENLRMLKRYFVKNVELGAQSMDDTVLALNGRGHTALDTENAVRLLRKHGFGVGLQMMTGLYGSDEKTDLFTASEFVRLSPDTVRIYPTTVLEHTQLAQLYKDGLYRPQTLEQAVRTCAKMKKMFYDNGISVIRMGLHAGSDVQGNMIAGVFHPAFGELCENEIYYQSILSALQDRPTGTYTVLVPTGELSKAVGQKKKNILRFSQRGYTLCMKTHSDIKRYEVKIEPTKETEETECT